MSAAITRRRRGALARTSVSSSRHIARRLTRRGMQQVAACPPPTEQDSRVVGLEARRPLVATVSVPMPGLSRSSQHGATANRSSDPPRSTKAAEETETEVLPQLKEAGVAFGADGSYQLTTDSFKFREHLKRTMKRNDARDELIQGLADSWEDASSLRQALSPMRMPAGAATSAGDGVKDSLVRMLLQVDPLQTELANMLFEKLGELQADMDTDGNSMPLPRLIISQFRWLEHVVDGEALINSVSQTLQVSRPPLHVHSPPLRRVAESPRPELSASCHASHGVCHASHNAPKPPRVGAGARLARADGAPARPPASAPPPPRPGHRRAAAERAHPRAARPGDRRPARGRRRHAERAAAQGQPVHRARARLAGQPAAQPGDAQAGQRHGDRVGGLRQPAGPADGHPLPAPAHDSGAACKRCRRGGATAGYTGRPRPVELYGFGSGLPHAPRRSASEERSAAQTPVAACGAAVKPANLEP